MSKATITALHTMYENGLVRDAQGNIIAFYHRTTGELTINYVPGTLYAMNEAHAMDLIAQHYKPREQ